MPIDIVATRRFMNFFRVLPAAKDFNKHLDHDLYRLTPEHPPIAQHPTVNDDLGNRIACGSVKVKADVKQFTATGVEFVDGSFEDDIDVVSFCLNYFSCVFRLNDCMHTALVLL